ncbi:hypothetical protein N9L76_02980 [bacterium]|nr:hypothetical protein [bacterium]
MLFLGYTLRVRKVSRQTPRSSGGDVCNKGSRNDMGAAAAIAAVTAESSFVTAIIASLATPESCAR